MEPKHVDVIKTLVISTVITVSTVLNTLVIAVIARYPQLREDRTALFVFSLTLSDLLMGCTAMPISAILCANPSSDVTNTTRFLPGIQQFCMMWLTFNSAYSLCWVTVTKMCAILYPFRFEQLFTHRRCYVIIGCIWFAGALVAGTGSQAVVPWSFATCTFNPGTGMNSVLSKFGTVLSFLPLIVMVYATARIFLVIVRANRQITAQVNSIGGQFGVVGNSASLTLQSIRSGRNVLLVCLGFVMLTVPIVVLLIMRFTGVISNLPLSYIFAAVWLAMCNSFLNSLLYLILFRGVRKKTASLFKELFLVCDVC